MKNTIINWEESFPHGLLDTSVLGTISSSDEIGLKTVIIAFDTEYNWGVFGAYENVCLSYQIAVSHVGTGVYNEGILYPDWQNNERFTLAYILEYAFGLIGISGRSIDGYHIILVGHFISTDLVMLKDRDKIVKRLEYINKVAISKGALPFHWYNACRNKISCTLNIKDTMLLLPASHLSLKKAADFVDEPKRDLNDDEISNILQLLLIDKPRFEDYAVADARITLKVFVKLQYYLNQLNETKSKVYSTLSSASIGKYLSYLNDTLPPKKKSFMGFKTYLFPKEKKHMGELYQKYEDLAKRGYLGGLNAAYNIGTFNDGVYLDMDFSSAYPTVMNMLNAPNFVEIPFLPLTDSIINSPHLGSLMIMRLEKAIQDFTGCDLKIGCADVTFRFPDTCLYPSLSIRHEHYGLIQPLEGRTVATIAELNLALKMGAELVYHDGFVLDDLLLDGKLFPLFRGHNFALMKQRNQAKADAKAGKDVSGNELLQNYLKTYVNSLYGKTGQGIRRSSSYSLKNGYSKVMPYSQITNPFYAMMITGTVRAALASVVDAIDSLKRDGHDYEVYSATTDGVLYKAPLSSIHDALDITIIQDKYDGSIQKAFKIGKHDFYKLYATVDPMLYNKLQEYPAIVLLETSVGYYNECL